MERRWAEYLGGFVTLKINGEAPERIINQATSRGIFLWDLRRKDQGMEVKVRLSAYKPLTHLVDTEHGLEIVDKNGLPFWRRRLANRLMLVAGALVFVFLLYFLSSLVWQVKVAGNNHLKTASIKSCAAAHGLYPGAFKWSFSKDEVSRELLKQFTSIAFVEVRVRGVTTTITVVEKILPPQDVSGPCHLVAAKDGVVTEVLPLEGQAVVKPGEAVAAGDILISGVIFPEPDYSGEQKPPYTVHARGQVKARVWYEGYGEWPMEVGRWQKTGKHNHQIAIYHAKKERTLFWWGKKQMLNSYYNQRTWSLPGNNKLVWKTHYEKVMRLREYTPDEALRYARDEALQQMQEILSNREKVLGTTWKLVSTPTEDIMRIKAVVEVEEDICRAEPIVVKD